MPQPVPRRCEKHGVVLDPFGHCVICKREDADGEEGTSARRAVGALLLLALVVACVLFYKGTMGSREPPVARVEVAASSAPRPADPIEDRSAPEEEERARVQAREVDERRAAIERKMREMPIRVYVSKDCALCRTATDFMKTKGYTFTEIDVDADAAALATMRKLNPKNTVPTIAVEDDVIVGFGPGVVMGALYRSAEKKVR
ncbi:Hypothetical protein A7982_03048 [Minicystis rosea]|nr:Hypothetical protein A7982_03048 [Minicystis rosea]